MSIQVHDGVFLGAIVPRSQILKSSTKYVSHQDAFDILAGGEKLPQSFTLEDAISHLNNMIKVNNEDAVALCNINDPYNETESNYYVGIFWEWSNRTAFKLDDKWKPLFLEVDNMDKSKILKERVFDIASKVIKELKAEDIKTYEVRFFE